jgi:3-oxoacyl-[acyl-carrier-protein] synthase II
VTRTVISAWSAVSAFGSQNADFAAGVRTGRRPETPLDEARWSGPRPLACTLSGFDARAELGPKSGSMDRLTALSVVATGRLLDDGTGTRRDGVGAGTALVLGTNGGSVDSVVGFTGGSLRKSRPYLVDPMRFPNTVMNCAAAQSAIWHKLHGPNATIAAGRASGLLALRYALRLHRAGRAEVICCGAAEEYSTTRAWMEHHAVPNGGGRPPLGEGCAMVLLEPAGRPARHGRAELAEILAMRFGVAEAAGVRPALAECVRRTLAAAGEVPERVWAAVSSGGADLPVEGEEAALTDVLGTGTPVRHSSSDLVGDTSAASALFALVEALALAAGEPGERRLALVTAVDRDGVLGCALLRLDAGRQLAAGGAS